jgi:hypothetical protein
MSTAPTRLSLNIDVFEKPDQLAKALPGLTPPELVEAILREFAPDLEYLSEHGEEYQLVRHPDGTPLQDDLPLQSQLRDNARLALVERVVPPPQGATVPPQAIYLRDLTGGRLHKLHWLPALIGRRDESSAQNPLLAVDLGVYTNGLRVSRRHAQIHTAGDQYRIESLARNNPTIVIREGERPQILDGQSCPLLPGDTIRLPSSELSFKFIVRDGRVPAGQQRGTA